MLEDTPITYQELSAEFSKVVANGVLALSKDKTLKQENQLEDSVMRIQQQFKEIWNVKLADRIVNLSPPPAVWSMEKREHYRQYAIIIHEALQDASPYLASRLREEIKV